MSELNDLFKLLAEAKRAAKENDVAGKVLTETTVRLKESNPFSANKVKPKETITEVAPLTEVDKVEEISSTSPVAPIAPPMERQSELKLVSDKLKYLENWVSRIANAGPGSGEVNFRWLDDVIRSTMTDLNDNWVLEYDAASWLALRGSITQNVIIGETETDGDKNTTQNSTDINTGASLKFGDLTVDGLIGTSGQSGTANGTKSGVLATDRLTSRVS